MTNDQALTSLCLGGQNFYICNRNIEMVILIPYD